MRFLNIWERKIFWQQCNNECFLNTIYYIKIHRRSTCEQEYFILISRKFEYKNNKIVNTYNRWFSKIVLILIESPIVYIHIDFSKMSQDKRKKIKIDIPSEFVGTKKRNRRFARKIFIAAQRLFPGIPRVQRYDKFPSVSVAHTLVPRDISQPFSIPGNAIPRTGADSANLLRSRPTNLPTVVPPASRGSTSVRELVIRRDAIKSVEKKVRKDEAARQQGGNNPEDEYAHVTDESSPIYHDETRGDTTTSPRPTINALI